LDVRKLSEIISSQAFEDEESESRSVGARQAEALPPCMIWSLLSIFAEQSTMQQIAEALGEPVAAVRNMAFKNKLLLNVTPSDIPALVETVARVVDVSTALGSYVTPDVWHMLHSASAALDGASPLWQCT
jgi:hypothetical protein